MSGLINCTLILSLSLELPRLPVHQAGPGPGLLPAVVVFDELRDRLVRQHLADSVERLSVKLESLFEQNLVFDAPLVRERGKVGEILKNISKLECFVNVIFFQCTKQPSLICIENVYSG